MKVKVYITDEGYGPLIRQSSIIEELRKLLPNLRVEIQTERHLEKARALFPDAEFTCKFNNVAWPRYPDGRPHLAKIRSFYSDYLARSERFISEEVATFDADFIISDFVCEAFQVGAYHDTPAFGVAHFTWDWFFAKMFPVPLDTDVLRRMATYIRAADQLYFPPMTPQEITDHYVSNLCNVPFIVRSHTARELPVDIGDRIPVLLMESGSGVMKEHFERAVLQLPEIQGCHFFLPGAVPESIARAPNVTGLPLKHLLIDYIPHMKLVIGRAGFNTISECIAFRTPILVIGELANAEMNENMINLKREGLGSFMSLATFTEQLGPYLEGFFQGEYSTMRRAMQNHQIPLNGAQYVARSMLEWMKVDFHAPDASYNPTLPYGR